VKIHGRKIGQPKPKESIGVANVGRDKETASNVVNLLVSVISSEQQYGEARTTIQFTMLHIQRQAYESSACETRVVIHLQTHM
jgi:hypothetical protein